MQTINIESTAPPDAVQDAFDDVIRAREDRQRTINEAMAYANAIIPAAQGQAQRLIEQGQGYRESVVAEAQGKANRFNSLLTQYEGAPGVMRERLYLDTMSEVLGRTDKVLVDAESSPMMYLPLDKLRSDSKSGQNGQNNQDANAQDVDPQLLERLRSQGQQSNRSSSSSNSSSGIQREGR